MKKYLKRIRDLQKDSNLNQDEIAKVLNVTQTNYSKYERDERKLQINQLITLCIYYNLSADYILGFTDEMKTLPKK